MGNGADPTQTTTVVTDTLNVLGSIFSPGELGSALTELNIDTETVSLIMDALTQGQEMMPHESHISSPTGSSFTTLPQGTELAYHTRLAREYLSSAVVEMLQTLGVYIDGVRAFRDGTTTTDTYSADELKKIKAVVDTTTAVNHRDYEHVHGGDHA